MNENDNYWTESIPLEMQLNLNELCEEDQAGNFRLVAVVAYRPYHYILFKFTNGRCYILNDSQCYSCPVEAALLLKGGDAAECNDLWLKTNNEKWVSCFMLYARDGCEVV